MSSKTNKRVKLLAFVDMHGSLKALEKIKKEAKKADILVCAGDISIFENNLDLLLIELNRLNKPVLIIPGNHENDRDLRQLSRMLNNIIDINKKGFTKGDYLFLGYGESGFNMVDKDFERLGKKFEKSIKKFSKEKKNKKIILVTHAPPYNTKLDKIMGESCGNKSIKAFILKTKPNLVISGHLHENAGKQDKTGNTQIINPGPFGRIIDI